MKKYGKIKWAVMSITVVIFILIIIAVIINAEGFYSVLNNIIMDNLMWDIGWIIDLVSLAMVIFCIYIIISPVGRIKLGGPDAKPEFSYMQWFGMSLCSGLGASIMFWAAAEPLLFTMEPSPSAGIESGSNAAVLWSMVRCFYEWGFTPYAICVTMGVILAYVILNKKAPFRVSSCLVPIFGKKVVDSGLSMAFDSLTSFAVTGAVSGALGMGTMQIASAISGFTGIEAGNTLYIGILVFLFAFYSISAIAGLHKGINFLSGINTKLFFGLLIFIFLAGPTAYIVNLFTESLGGYFTEFFSISLNTAPYADSEMWPQLWDMFFMADWMAFAPTFGLFMVRLAKGRTLREFIMIEWLLPAIVNLIWFSVFGGTILHAQLYDGIDFYAIYLEGGAQALTLAALDVLPLSAIVKVVFVIVVAAALIIQCNSMSVTLAGMCMDDSTVDTEAPAYIKLFWGIVFAVIAAVFVILGGIDGIKTIKCLCGIPLTFICGAVMIGFLVYMAKRPKNDSGEYECEDEVKPLPGSRDEN